MSTRINVADDTWHHVALTLGGGTVTVYLDGVVRATYSGYSVSEQINDLLIGERAANFGQAFNGSIDGLRIWNVAVARTQAQIQSTMNSHTPTGTGLLAAYYFNQSSANGSNGGVTTLTEATGNSLNGTLDEILVLNNNGQVLLRSTSTQEIDLSNWEAGVYWVQLISGRNRVTHKVLKQ